MDAGQQQQQQQQRREEMVMRKGPWMAEEDEILIDYVKKYGPRDWSSIRSKGLLPRTGKSCRLRWVNKLKPDLKTGCKFSAEEERVVIELQSRYGNKWARIATHLPGRTDNDVKNFWSTRQKRLARLLQTPNQPKSHKKAASSHRQASSAAPQASRLTASQVEQELSARNQSCQAVYMENPEVIKMLPFPPDVMNPHLPSFEPNLPQLEYMPTEKHQCIEPQPLFCFPQLPQPALDLPMPLLSDGQDLPNLTDIFYHQGTSGSDHCSQYSVNLPFLGVKSEKGDNDNPATPDSFDIFPEEEFDYMDSLPSSSEW